MTIFLWFHVLPYIRHLLYIHQQLSLSLSLSLSFPPISLPSAFFASCLCHKSLGVREGEREGEEERGRHTCLQATPPPPSPSHSGYLRYGPRQENIPQIFLSGRPLKWYCYVLQSSDSFHSSPSAVNRSSRSGRVDPWPLCLRRACILF